MTISESTSYVVFSLEEQKYALYLSAVERILRMVEITPLPKAPDVILGIVNVGGQVIPVANLRQRFGLPERDIDLSDHLIVAHTGRRTVALVVNEVNGVLESHNERVVPTEKVLPSVKNIKGVIKIEDGLILIYDLETFLSLEEEKMLSTAIESLEDKG